MDARSQHEAPLVKQAGVWRPVEGKAALDELLKEWKPLGQGEVSLS